MTVTLQIALAELLSVAVMYTFPADFAVIFPFLSTVAIFVLEAQAAGQRRATGCRHQRRGRHSACCQSFHARLQERGHAACTRGGRGLHFQRLSLLQGQAERCAQGTRSAEGAHG